jgi:hypothetical protein
MLQKCNNVQNKDFHHYGGRGITVCDEWYDLENFIKDMDDTYIDGLTLDRENVNLGYNKCNCRWATRAVVQTRNTRGLKSNNTSGYRGVCLDKSTNKWVARIKAGGKNIYLGTFDCKVKAAEAYDNYVLINRLEHTLNFEF